MIDAIEFEVSPEEMKRRANRRRAARVFRSHTKRCAACVEAGLWLRLCPKGERLRSFWVGAFDE